MTIEKDYIKTLRHIKHNLKRLAWDDMRGEYKNAIEAIDKAIEALQDKGYQTPDHCPFCGGSSAHKGMDLDKLFKNCCSYIENLTDEEWSIALQEAKEHTKDCYDD